RKVVGYAVGRGALLLRKKVVGAEIERIAAAHEDGVARDALRTAVAVGGVVVQVLPLFHPDEVDHGRGVEGAPVETGEGSGGVAFKQRNDLRAIHGLDAVVDVFGIPGYAELTPGCH